MNETFTSRYGGTFTTAAERDAWDGLHQSKTRSGDAIARPGSGRDRTTIQALINTPRKKTP